MPNTQNAPVQKYHHGRFRVAGGVLPDAVTAYQTFGDPSKPCIVFPTCFTARLDGSSMLGQTYMIGEDKALQPSKYFIVTFATFSNGESSSPSNTPAPYNGPYFPAISRTIRAQYAVLTKILGVKKVYAAIGYSTGGQQAFYWPIMYVPICSAACTISGNLIEGPKAALIASKDFHDGHYTSTPEIGLRAFARAYSTWSYGQTWFRDNPFHHNGAFPDLDSFLREVWEALLIAWDANDILGLLHTWYAADVSLINEGGNFQASLSAIKAKGLIMPCKTDLYFTPEDSEIEVSHLTNATLVVIDSVWGHVAGSFVNPDDVEFIKNEVRAFLEA
ncbi:homoserine acetyltransferase [Phellopilus nigrolimitatus]|nr:homoserine acetyltransferase [Phellopilus nigrolimitatus]